GSRESGGHAGQINSGDCANAAESLTNKGRLGRSTCVGISLWIIGNRKPDARSNYTGRIETRIRLEQSSKGTQQQAGANHEHDRQGQLGNDQSATQPIRPGAVAGTTSAFSNGSKDIWPGGLKSRGQ